MIITSEITGKQYKTVDACVEDERKFIAVQEEERKKKEELRKHRDEANKKVEEAYQTVVDSWKNYEKVLEDAGLRISPIDEMFFFLEVIEHD